MATRATGVRRDDTAAAAAPLELVPLDGLDDCRETWMELAERSRNLFSTWEWASTWWGHFGGDRALSLIGCRRSDGSLAGILPLYLSSSRPLRVLRLLGHGQADQLAPVCGPADRGAVAQALRRALDGAVPRWDVFLGERHPRPEGWSGLLGATPMRHEASPTLVTRGISWEQFLASRSANFRQQVRRRERKLVREHGIRFRLSDDPTRLERDLDSLFSLHVARWEGTDSDTFASADASFHRSFAAVALERGWLRLWLAEAEGRPVAAWYGFRFANAEWYYQAGRDPAWDSTSIGVVLLAWTIREAISGGVGEYRFLLGNEPYKARFTREDPGLETFAITHGAIGAAAVRGALALRRSPPTRRLLSRVARARRLVD